MYEHGASEFRVKHAGELKSSDFRISPVSIDEFQTKLGQSALVLMSSSPNSRECLVWKAKGWKGVGLKVGGIVFSKT